MSPTSRSSSSSRRSSVACALVPASFVGFAVEQLDLGAQHGQGRAELVGGVRDEVALAFERALEPVEHVVEGVGQHADLAAPRSGPARTDSSPALDGGGDAGHAPQGSGDQRRQADARRDGQQQREHSDDHERAAEACLRLLHRGQRVGDAQRSDTAVAVVDRCREDPHASRPRRPTRSPARSGESSSPVASGACSSRTPSRASSSGSLLTVLAAGGLHDDQQRLGVVALGGDELRGRRARAPPGVDRSEWAVNCRHSDSLRSQLGVDLRSQARAGAAVKGKEAGADGERRDERDRERQLRA